MPPLQQNPMASGGMPPVNNLPPVGGNNNTMLAMTETNAAKPKRDVKLIGLIACGVVAFLSMIMALVSFVDSGNKAAEIKKLKNQIANGESIVIDGETISTSARAKNPVLTATYPQIYNLDYDSKTYEMDGGALYNFTFTIRDGKVITCSAKKILSGTSGYSEDNKQCAVNGVSGNIYKVVDITDPDNPEGDLLAFLLEDGTIDFVKIYLGLKNMQFNVAGKINPGGFATDVMNVRLYEQESLSGKEVMLMTLADGSFVEYKKSMLQFK